MLAEFSVPEVVSRTLHLFAAIMAVGGAIFIRRAISSSAQATVKKEEQAFLEALVKRTTILVHVSIMAVIVTGLWNMALTLGQHRGQLAYHVMLGIKVGLALVLLGIAAGLTGHRPAMAFMRRRPGAWIVFSIVIALAIILLSNILKQMPPAVTASV